MLWQHFWLLCLDGQMNLLLPTFTMWFFLQVFCAPPLLDLTVLCNCDIVCAGCCLMNYAYIGSTLGHPCRHPVQQYPGKYVMADSDATRHVASDIQPFVQWGCHQHALITASGVHVAGWSGRGHWFLAVDRFGNLMLRWTMPFIRLSSSIISSPWAVKSHQQQPWSRLTFCKCMCDDSLGFNHQSHSVNCEFAELFLLVADTDVKIGMGL